MSVFRLGSGLFSSCSLDQLFGQFVCFTGSSFIFFFFFFAASKPLWLFVVSIFQAQFSTLLYFEASLLLVFPSSSCSSSSQRANLFGCLLCIFQAQFSTFCYWFFLLLLVLLLRSEQTSLADRCVSSKRNSVPCYISKHLCYWFFLLLFVLLLRSEQTSLADRCVSSKRNSVPCYISSPFPSFFKRFPVSSTFAAGKPLWLFVVVSISHPRSITNAEETTAQENISRGMSIPWLSKEIELKLIQRGFM
jgi:hypothetical protein